MGARLDVPVRADHVEVTRIDVAGLDRAQRAERLGHAEQLGDGAIDVEGEPLREVGDIHRCRNAPCRGDELAGDETQERRLARAVAADEPGAKSAEGARDVFERR